MKKILFWGISSLLAVLVLVQCKPNTEKTEAVKTEESIVKDSNSHQITVKEVLNANAYTYLLVTEAEKEYWIAVPKTEVTVGKNYTYEGGMEMKKFESKDLKRTFDSVLFVEGIIDPNGPAVSETTSTPVKVVSSKVLSKGITLAKGGISVFDLYSTRDKLAGKTVILTGKVIKFMPDIMKKNWIHLQDGSNFNGLNDITITTLEKVKVDDIVTLKGKVVLNKDLGSGYKYDVLIEDATVVK
ncbi:DNA-binding protein [Flavobacterium franklandianum]|uniref:DNA-binding protein n=1 Tax=Flavobacterium franklandianum TaxID=2594430 RepID=UPI00117BC241|nr:DNA-binding protein [Flavobacterium franklandianum]TRX28741.1 DNA-binding protein [Flavobacterium franklandianum]